MARVGSLTDSHDLMERPSLVLADVCKGGSHYIAAHDGAFYIIFRDEQFLHVRSLEQASDAPIRWRFPDFLRGGIAYAFHPSHEHAGKLDVTVIKPAFGLLKVLG